MSDFFQVGGALNPNLPSYIPRKADQELIEALDNNLYSYIFTARQMGKSSLMHQTALTLKNKNVASSIIDITAIGGGTDEQWYFSFLNLIRQGLNLEYTQDELINWWQEKLPFSPVQSFIGFWQEIALKDVDKNVVVFIDEIDAITGVGKEFAADFLGAIRSCYNLRASASIFERLTFVLIGVAEPTDLINDPTRTPFNIGQRIELLEFTVKEAANFAGGLEDEGIQNSKQILNNVYHWTNGQPYLTQLLCLKIATSEKKQWSSEDIKALVQKKFFSKEGLKEINIETVRRSVEKTPQREKLLRTYRNILNGGHVTEDKESSVQNYLKLYGLLRSKQGKLHLSNRIYENVFNKAWVESLLPDVIATPTSPQPSPEDKGFIIRYWLPILIGAVLLIGVGLAIGLSGRKNGPSQPPPTKRSTPTPKSEDAVVKDDNKEDPNADQGDETNGKDDSYDESSNPTPADTIEPTITPISNDPDVSTQIEPPKQTPLPEPLPTDTYTPYPTQVTPTVTVTPTETPLPPDPPTATSRAVYSPILQNLSCSGNRVNFRPGETITFEWTWAGNLWRGEYLEVRVGAEGGQLQSMGRVFDGQEGQRWRWNLVPQGNFLDGINSNYQWQVVHMASNGRDALATSSRGCLTVNN